MKNYKKKISFKIIVETFFTPNLSRDAFLAAWFHLPPVRSLEPGRARQPKRLLSLWGDSAAPPEEIKQFSWKRDFVHTATGVKFTLRTSQSADADQTLTSPPLQTCCSVAAREVQREKVSRLFCLFDSGLLWGFPQKRFEWFIWYLNDSLKAFDI